MPFWENCITSMYIATHVTALYSACTSALRRRAAFFSFSPSRGANLLGSGSGSKPQPPLPLMLLQGRQEG